MKISPHHRECYILLLCSNDRDLARVLHDWYIEMPGYMFSRILESANKRYLAAYRKM